ncbi:hypothetical protein C8A05DRAFT_14905 [Staphylotrichum tortipilum]|uniref:RNA ligase domain-containing protein n=1 Tax=Staphylotrichum tortipilum TaxID=2831512 RepID=A0AAN6RUL2_9PEZI|nr:hypothetical protein C8A05DRAFT_14905 [Staphylotrichum longicolle]
MSPDETRARPSRFDLRGWLEAAILSSNATLPPTPPRSTKSGSSTKAGSSSAQSSSAQSSSAQSISAQSNSASSSAFSTSPASHSRKLATVRLVTAVKPINRTHSVATVDGWKVVVPKAKHFVQGHYVLFFEVDAFLPCRSPFAEHFAEAGSRTIFDGDEGYRVGTSAWTDWQGNEIISQGHICHVTLFPSISDRACDLHWKHRARPEETIAAIIRDIDFSAELGIQKWEAFPDPPPLTDPTVATDILTANTRTPSFIPKTDTERVQNCPNLFTKPKYSRHIFQESLKMDGSTITIYFIPRTSPIFSTLPDLPPISPGTAPNPGFGFLKHAIHPTGRLGVCSRKQDLLPHLLTPTSSSSAANHTPFWTATIAADLHKLLPALNQPIAIQAELVGDKVQGNPYTYPPGKHELFVFSISLLLSAGKNGAPAAARRWDPREVEAFAEEHGLKHVPVLGYRVITSIARHHEDLITRAELKKGEGLVFKNCVDGRWFKVLSNGWIIEKGDESAATSAKRKGKGKMGEGGEKEVCRGWEMDEEGKREIREIRENLEEWMEKDEGVRVFMEQWEREWYREREGGGGMGGGKGAAEFGLSKKKREEVLDWLGM